MEKEERRLRNRNCLRERIQKALTLTSTLAQLALCDTWREKQIDFTLKEFTLDVGGSS